MHNDSFLCRIMLSFLLVKIALGCEYIKNMGFYLKKMEIKHVGFYIKKGSTEYFLLSRVSSDVKILDFHLIFVNAF